MKKMKLLLASVLLAMSATAAVTFDSLGGISYRAVDDKLGMFVKEPVLYYGGYTTEEGSYSCWDIYSLLDLSLQKQIKLKNKDENEAVEYSYVSFKAFFAQYESISKIYESYISMTQTLFNDDDKYEFVRAVYRLGEVQALRYEIVNEDGEVLCLLPEEINNTYLDYRYVIGLKDGYALAFEVGEGVLISYKINKDASGLSLTKLSTTKAYPNPVNSSNSFTIDVDETKLGTTNYVEVVDESGRMVYRSEMKGSKAVVPARRMRGMNVYRIVSDGEVVDTGKMLVK